MTAFGLHDEFASRDRPEWGSTPVTVLPVTGPEAFGFAPRLRRCLDRESLDLLHVHGLWMYPSVASLGWARRHSRPVVISPHGMLDPWAVRKSRWKKRVVGKLYEDRHLARAAALHALCSQEADGIRAYGLRNSVCVIPNGVDVPSSAPTEPPPWEAEIPEGANVLLYLGRLHPKKNLTSLLKAWERFAARGGDSGDWWLAIVGWDQNGHQRQLQQLVSDLRIPRVWFGGPRFGAEKQAALARAQAFILPSLSEGLPMAVLEAWSHGLPVVMTPECNLPRGFESGAALRAGTTPESLGTALEELAGMTGSNRRAMGECGRSLVERDYSWPRIAEQMIELYRWVLGDGPKPDCVI